MSSALSQNIRLALLIVSILAGVAVQKHSDHAHHADCSQCIHTSAAV